MNDDALAEFQRRLLDALVTGNVKALGSNPALDAELQRYVQGFDPDAVALARELWRKWGRLKTD